MDIPIVIVNLGPAKQKQAIVNPRASCSAWFAGAACGACKDGQSLTGGCPLAAGLLLRVVVGNNYPNDGSCWQQLPQQLPWRVVAGRRNYPNNYPNNYPQKATGPAQEHKSQAG